MLINMRNATLGGQKWRNPYVTDGLVAMVDGVWNVAGGIHSATADNVTDIASGHTFTRSGTGFSWSANALVLSGNTYFGATLPEITTSLTAECVCRYNSTPPSSGNFKPCLSNRASNWTSRVFQMGVDSSGKLVTMVRSGLPQSAVGYEGTTAQSMTFVWNKRSAAAYSNAKFKSSGTSDASYETALALQPFIIGKSYTSSYWTWIGDIHCVRLYSRALTADEIAHNYAVDKARFGLPEAT